MLLVLVLRPKVLEKYQVHSSTLYLIKSYILYIDSSEFCVDTIEYIHTLSVMILQCNIG